MLEIYLLSIKLCAKLLIYNCRGGGDLLGQLHALAEAELNLGHHQKRLSEIEAKVILLALCILILRQN